MNDCGGAIPAFNKTVKIMKKKNAEAVYNVVCSAKYLDYED